MHAAQQYYSFAVTEYYSFAITELWILKYFCMTPMFIQ